MQSPLIGQGHNEKNQLPQEIMAPQSKTKSASLEIFSIYLIVFGLFILGSVGAALRGVPESITYDDNSLWYLIALEVITGGTALIILRSRGWTTKNFHFQITTTQTFLGVIVSVIDCLFYWSTEFALKTFSALPSPNLIIGNISLTTAIATALVNPLYEEFFVVAYTIERMEKAHGRYFAIALSAFVRFSYHLYQGPTSIWIFLMGLLHAFIYTKWRKIWPLVIAHAILNFMAFGL